MKLIAIAAAALTIAAPTAIAQTMPAQDAPKAKTATAPEADPRGGYQPTTPLYSGPVTADTKVIFRPNTQTPDQAFPPPAPMADYPICQPGQYDNCRQRGG